MTCDYAVIGAGHNGLVAGCRLAQAGYAVTIIEQRAIAGGLAMSHAYLPEAPQHLLSLGAMDDALLAATGLATKLGLLERGYAPVALEHPYGWMGPEGETLLLFKDFERTCKDIHYFSPDDARRYRELRQTLDFLMATMDKLGAVHPAHLGKRNTATLLLQMATSKTMRKHLGRMLSTSVFEMIAETFTSTAMRGLWAFWASMFAPATVPGTGIYLSGFANVHRVGIYRPRGGMAGLIHALQQCFTENGGVVKLNSPVQSVLLENGRAAGVALRSGEVIKARCGVLASCAPQILFNHLLPTADLPEPIRQRLSFIPSNSIGVAPFKIDIASGPLNYFRAQNIRRQRDNADLRKTTFMTGTLEQHITQHQACARGQFIEAESPLYFSILSGADSSVAPENHDVLYVYSHSPTHPQRGWQVEKQPFAEQIMATAARYIDGLSSEIGRVVTSPQDFSEQFSAPDGAYFHVDMLPSRLGMNRPCAGLGGYETPVPGLYLAGSGSHPGGGVSGLPGNLAADFILKK
jgi:phytoene dehydrogenase-like protein